MSKVVLLLILLICYRLPAVVYPDLANAITTNTQATTNGLTYNKARLMDTFMQLGVGTNFEFIVNSNWWFHFCPERTASSMVKWSGSSTPTNCTDQEDVNLIAPCYALTCAHAPTVVGEWVGFIDDNGVLVAKQTIATTNVAGSDVELILLDSDVPSTVHPYRLLPSAVTNYILNPISLLAESKHQDEGWGAGLLSGNIVYDLFLQVDNSATNYLGSGWNEAVTGGDSGCPTSILINTNLVLIGHWYSYGIIANYAHFTSAINAAMHLLSANHNLGSDYQIQSVNVSQFHMINSNSIPTPPANLHIAK
ncbi:MAG: hypothetical protein ABSA45_04440 [Verrucomicrobiota bacterium]|jgi:hypothetical protein